MMHNIWRIGFVAIAAMTIAACVRVPVMDIENASFSIPPSVNATLPDVEKAIYRGAVEQGWSVRQLAPGNLEAELYSRRYKVVVQITHDTKVFSIKYKDSENLDYNGTEIRRAYNKWILKLRLSILREASRLR